MVTRTVKSSEVPARRVWVTGNGSVDKGIIMKGDREINIAGPSKEKTSSNTNWGKKERVWEKVST